MVKLSLFVRLEAKPGKEAAVEEFLRAGLPIVQKEPGTIAWFAVRFGPKTFGIFDNLSGRGGTAGTSLGRGRGSTNGKGFGAFRETARDRESGRPRGQASVTAGKALV
jgi:hypothetical protein